MARITEPVTTENYFTLWRKLGIRSLREDLKEGHNYVRDVTANFKSWRRYNDSRNTIIRKAVNKYLKRLNEYLSDEPTETAKIDISAKKVYSKQVPRLSEEIQFVRRYLNLHNRIKTKEQILRFINALQKAILEKRITKLSPFKEQIIIIQKGLINFYNAMPAHKRFEVSPADYKKLIEAPDKQRVWPSIKFIKKYIDLNGRTGVKALAAILLEQIDSAKENNELSAKDPFSRQLTVMRNNLVKFTERNSPMKTLTIQKAELNGLEGILEDYESGALEGYEETGQFEDTPLYGLDFADSPSNTLHFKGKWLDFIGTPSSDFNAVVFGRPLSGMFTLCIEFAAYLAHHFGKVLYVTQNYETMRLKGVKHPNLFTSLDIPKDLSRYDFIFLDSVDSLGLDTEYLYQLKDENPSKALIAVFEVSGEDDFRNMDEYRQQADIVIQVQERGRAIQYGKYNHDSEMLIPGWSNY